MVDIMTLFFYDLVVIDFNHFLSVTVFQDGALDLDFLANLTLHFKGAFIFGHLVFLALIINQTPALEDGSRNLNFFGGRRA